jgi:hypothetical protein
MEAFVFTAANEDYKYVSLFYISSTQDLTPFSVRL